MAYSVTTVEVRPAKGAHLENLGERFDDTRVFVTIHLHGVDERHLGLGAVAERFQDVRESLRIAK